MSAQRIAGMGVVLLVLGVTASAVDILRLDDGGSVRLRMQDTGALEIAASDGSRPGLQVRQTGGGKVLAALAGGSEVLTVAGNGRVGIGITNPGQRLEVAGNIRLSGGRVMNVGAPAAASDVATKAYVDAAGGGGGATSFHRVMTSTALHAQMTDLFSASGPGVLYGARKPNSTGSIEILLDGTSLVDHSPAGILTLYNGFAAGGSPLPSISFKTELRIRGTQGASLELLYGN